VLDFEADLREAGPEGSLVREGEDIAIRGRLAVRRLRVSVS
jgi:hypothetical protein